MPFLPTRPFKLLSLLSLSAPCRFIPNWQSQCHFETNVPGPPILSRALLKVTLPKNASDLTKILIADYAILDHNIVALLFCFIWLFLWGWYGAWCQMRNHFPSRFITHCPIDKYWQGGLLMLYFGVYRYPMLPSFGTGAWNLSGSQYIGSHSL